MKIFTSGLCVAAVAFLPSCATQKQVPADALIVVKDVQIPDSEPWIARFAKHSWVEYRPDTESPWRRIEVMNETSGLLHHEIEDATAASPLRWRNKVRVLAQSNAASNPNFVEDIIAFAQNYDAERYHPWPGPNSNSFAERLVKAVDGIDAKLDHNAVGKGYGFYAGRTAGGTGVELQSSFLGGAVGLREGMELSVIGLSAGVSFVPFSINLPFLPGVPPR